MSIAQEVKERLDIVDIISEYVPLKRVGRNMAGFCPFHHNTRTPAFYVSPERQSWRCFGACAESGDMISFVMKREGMEFIDALKLLAAKANVEVPEYRPKPQEQQQVEDRLSTLIDASAEYFHQLLLHAPEAEQARQYIRSRKLTKGSVTRFKLGYSLDSFDACLSHFTGMGYSQQELLDVGLLTENEEKASTYDRFRNRLMFPIRNTKGSIVGFGARTLEKDGIPKYLNSPQTALFDKSKLLYGLSAGSREIREARQAVIVEGYMDVIRAHQAGFRNVIAQMGTALTETQLRTLKRFTKRFIIALDADEAGVNATMRSLEVARETLDRDVEITFNARGLVQQEGRLKADIRVAKIPVGKDPDDIISEDPGLWVELIHNAQPIVAYVIETLTEGVDLSEAKQKSAVAEQIIPLINDLPDPIERSHYLQKLAARLGIDETVLHRFTPQKKRRSRTPKPNEASAPSSPPDEEPPEFFDDDALVGTTSARMRRHVAPLVIENIEADYLRQMLAYPEIMVRVDMLLKKAQQPTISQEDFSSTEDQALWKMLRRRAVEGKNSDLVTIEMLCDSLDVVLASRVQALLLKPASPASLRDQLPSRLAQSVLNWRLDKVKRLLSDVQQLMESAKASGDEQQTEELAYRCQELLATIYSINRARHSMSVAGSKQEG